jgi:3-deoxy-D-manno-octulosonate 8-phosphate phosphatase (KDO 8-P phosphatase)
MATNGMHQQRWNNIRAIAFDVDGVLTDGGIWWGANGEEFRRFSFSDIMGISLAHRSGFVTALISGETSPLIHRYAARMSIKDVFMGCRDKASTLRDFALRNHLDLGEISFMGDDVNDLSAMEIAGLSAAPSNAHATVRKKASFVTKSAGGDGAVRELIDALLAAQGLAMPVVANRERKDAKVDSPTVVRG